MELSRRNLLRAGLFSMAAAGIGGTAACGGSGGETAAAGGATELTLWYWGGGLSDKVVAEAVKNFSKITLKPSVIGGDFKQKLVTTMNGRKFVPDITGIKGENIASLLAESDRFLDLNTLGADKLRSQYVEWKWKQGSTTDGKLIGFPIDIGPTGMFYREDIFKKGGLPTDPAEVSESMSTWDDLFAAGQKLKKAVPDAFIVDTATGLFDVAVGQGPKRFIDESNKFIGDQAHIRTAWDVVVKALQLGVVAPKTDGQDTNIAMTNGKFAAMHGAAWMALDIKNGAQGTEGKWRVAGTPVGPANIGGSFLALTQQCRDPKLAFEIITWLLSPENAAKGFTDSALFPASPATYAMSAMTEGDPFFGGQVTIEVLGEAAKKVPVQYEAPADAAVGQPFKDEILNVWTKDKNPDTAWTDAVASAKQIAERQGVS
ncbi:extracellular solute-binding protein [Nonomuraea basaltis]|uniref:extracellular solute-binding protein n=1 Tax=Nonomuraea basaltis TaxID=2495887 RepID=UPI00110C609F|nr:extracellular solute-binding protein [Nonomuraea basaltis]TMR90252.1 extracellular solute-binding protein [Nonomuraea basaltis]